MSYLDIILKRSKNLKGVSPFITEILEPDTKDEQEHPFPPFYSKLLRLNTALGGQD